MAVNTRIECVKSGEVAQLKVNKGLDAHRQNGLVVYSEPLRDFPWVTKVALNDTYGANLAINVAFSGTPEVIHNGTDSAAWTGSNLSGTNFVFNSTAQAQAGTRSIDGTATVHNDQALLDRGSTTTASSWAGISGYIYLTAWSGSGTKDVGLQLYNSASVGSQVGIGQFIDTTLLNTWQSFSIPMDEFNYGGNMDGITIRTIDIGGGPPPDYYLDTVQLEETGGATFTIEPDPNTVLNIKKLVFTFTDADHTAIINSGSTSNQFSMQPNNYDEILGLGALATPVSVVKESAHENSSSVIDGGISSLGSLLISPYLSDIQMGGNGTGSWMRVTAEFPDNALTLDSRKIEYLSLFVFDDLTALTQFTVTAAGYCEEL